MLGRTLVGIGVGLLVGAVAAGPPSDRFEATVARVVDGDSLWVRRDGASAPLRLRLWGLDAPEICQDLGPAAREALAARLALAGNRVQVQRLGRDSYERWLVRLHTADGDVAAWLVAQGLAWNGGAYARQEAAARRQRLGVFAEREPERPRDFRRRHGPCPPGR